MSDYTDKELVALYRTGDNAHYAFNLIVQKYQRKIYAVIRRLVIDHDDTNDIMQNVFIKVWKNLNNFREDSNLYTWIYKIANNESLTFITSRRKKIMISLENVMVNPESPANIEGDEILKKLQKAIHSLPEKQRVVFNMKYYDELKYEEMAEVLNTSVGALKASYHHAVKKIEEYLKQD